MRNKKIAAVAAGSVMVLGVGTAYAYWTTSGDGDGTATTANPTGVLTVAQTNGQDANPALTAMFPGDSAQTVHGLVTNTNPETYFVKSVTVVIESVTKQDGTALTGCDRDDYLLGGEVADADGVTVNVGPSGAGVQLVKDATVPFSTAIQFNNKAESQDACKNAKVNLDFDTNAA